MNQTKIIAAIIICMCIIAFPFANPNTYGLAKGNALFSFFSFHFLHDNILHLSLNTYIFYQNFNLLDKTKTHIFNSPIISILCLFLCVTPISILCISSTPTIGLSAINHAILGYITATFRHYQKTLILMISSTIGLNLLSFILSNNFAWTLHILSFFALFIFKIIFDTCKK